MELVTEGCEPIASEGVPSLEELLSKAEYKRQVLEALPKLEQLDDTYR